MEKSPETGAARENGSIINSAAGACPTGEDVPV